MCIQHVQIFVQVQNVILRVGLHTALYLPHYVGLLPSAQHYPSIIVMNKTVGDAFVKGIKQLNKHVLPMVYYEQPWDHIWEY